MCEEKRNYATYFLIAGGLVIAVLSKVTAGMLIGLTAIIYVIWYCIKHKSIKLICCKQFFDFTSGLSRSGGVFCDRLFGIPHVAARP